MKFKTTYVVLGLSAAIATVVYGASQLGRNSAITWPDLGDAAGSSQVDTIQAAITELSNDDNSRYRTGTAIADSTLATYTHDFGVAFGELSVLLYTGTHPSLTRVSDPAGSGWTIVANGGNPLTQIDVTTPGSGGPHTYALQIVQAAGVESLNDLDDVDLTTTAPEDSQALVYDSGSSEWIPGSSGDASFKCQEVSDPNLTIKSGFLIQDNGVELQIASDLVVSLDTIFGSDPVDATAYYLFLDLDQVPAVSLLANGRQVRVVSSASHFSIQTALPDLVDQSRYVPICFLRSADAGTVWSGTGSDVATLATRRHGRPVVNISPTQYELDKQSVGSIGSFANIQGALSASDFPGAGADTSFWELISGGADGSVNGYDLTARTAMVFDAPGFFGRTLGRFDGVDDDWLRSSSEAFFKPGLSVSMSWGGWFTPNDLTQSTAQQWMGVYNPIGNQRAWRIYSSPTDIFCAASSDGTSATTLGFDHSGLESGIPIHFACVYDFSTTTLHQYLNGQLVGEVSHATGIFASSSDFLIGTRSDGSERYSGTAQDVFVHQPGALTADEINKIYSHRFSNNQQVAGGHVLDTSSFDDIDSTRVSFFNLNADALDDSGNGRNLTNGGSTPFTGLNIFGQSGAADLDGVDDNLSSTDAFFDPGGTFSLAGWFRLDKGIGPTGVSRYFASQRDTSAAADTAFTLFISGAGTRLDFFTTDGTSFYNLDVQLEDYNPGWNHWVFTYNDITKEKQIYVNGNLEASNTLHIGVLNAVGGSRMFRIGSTFTAPVLFADLTVEQFVFAHDVLTAAQIRKLASTKLDHNQNVLKENQQWYGNFFKGDNSTVSNELDQGYLLDKTLNSSYIDLGLESGDSVSLRMQNQSTSSTVVPVKTYTSGLQSSAPSFPVSHSLGCTPKDFYVLHEGPSLAGDFDKRYDLCSADATSLTCDLSSLTIDASHRVNVVASCAPIATAVPEASETDSGIMTTSAQTIGGEKTYIGPDGSATVATKDADLIARFQNNSVAGDNASIDVSAGTSGTPSLCLGDTNNGTVAAIQYRNNGNTLDLRTSAATRLSVNSTGASITPYATGDGASIPGESFNTLYSGTYSPSLPVTAADCTGKPTTLKAHFMRVGEVVTVSGALTMTAGGCGQGETTRMSLPVPATVTSDTMISGSAQCTLNGSSYGTVVGDGAGSGGATIQLRGPTVCTTKLFYHYTYRTTN